MSRRTEQLKKVVAQADEACKGIGKDEAGESQFALGEILHAKLGLPPNEIVVVAKFTNGRDPLFELRCHICGELLSQRSVASWPVTLARVDGSRFPAVLVTCSDAECHRRFFERLDTEGP